QRDNYTDTPPPPDEPAGANPPDGVVIDYYLAHTSSAPVTLEILDARGQLVRKFSSTDKPDATEEELRKQLIPLYWLRPFRSLSADAGMHRWVWDLHYPAPESTRHEYPISAIPGDTPRLPLGPTALPGTYTARLTVDGKSLTAPFVVKMDPRVKTSAAGLEKKFQLETRLASLLSQTSQASLQAGSIRDPLQKLSQQATGPVHDSVQAFQNKLVGILGAPAGFAAPPANEITLSRVNGQVATLYGQVWQVDAEPTAPQSEAVAATEHDAQDVMQRWDAIRTTDLRALNHALTGASLPEVKIDTDLHKEDGGMDEE
ncbi:MAG: glycoside hydrolase, partial [Candidatus Sulfotelmatobacter sp.]